MPEHTRPNILYLHCHDAGRYVQPYGHAIATPGIQRLAEQGVLFRKAFTTSPTCSPSRAALLSGQYAHCAGMLGLAHRGFKLKDYRRHIVHTLHAAGYTSALAGVQHVARSTAAGVIGYERILTLDGNGVAPTAAAVDFLNEQHDKPFFLSVGYAAPHRGEIPHRPFQSFPAFGPPADPRYVLPPQTLPDTPQTRQDYAEYIASVQSTDANFGHVLDALDRTGLAERTLVIATTDHGIAFPGHKCRLTDHGTGVMLILRGPHGGALRGGKVIDAMVTQLDLFPTICALAEIAPPPWLQGKSLLPLIDGQVDRLHDAIFGEVSYHAAYEPMRAIRTERWKYIRRFGDRAAPVLPNCDDSLSKTVLCDAGWPARRQPAEMLYDLSFDPGEAHNLVGEPALADVLRGLRERLESWMRSTDDPLLNGPIPLPKDAIVTPQDRYSPRDR